MIGEEGKERISKFHALMSSYATSHQTLVVDNMCFLSSFFFWKRKERNYYVYSRKHISRIHFLRLFY
jgi:hypothetical protein